MSAREKEYVGQVIIEKGFASRAAAEEWVAKMRSSSERRVDNTETHVWEPVKS